MHTDGGHRLSDIFIENFISLFVILLLFFTHFRRVYESFIVNSGNVNRSLELPNSPRRQIVDYFVDILNMILSINPVSTD